MLAQNEERTWELTAYSHAAFPASNPLLAQNKLLTHLVTHALLPWPSQINNPLLAHPSQSGYHH